MRRWIVLPLILAFVLIISVSFVSANIFSDFWSKITGKVTASCGNGILEGEEFCDGTNFGSFSCASFGLSSGTLTCTSDCNIDTSQCTSTPSEPEETAPEVASTLHYVYPTENSGAVRARNYIEVNVTSIYQNLDKIKIGLYNSLHEQINFSITGTSPNFINFTDLADGLYFYNATANDTGNNIVVLETRNITLSLGLEETEDTLESTPPADDSPSEESDETDSETSDEEDNNGGLLDSIIIAPITAIIGWIGGLFNGDENPETLEEIFNLDDEVGDLTRVDADNQQLTQANEIFAAPATTNSQSLNNLLEIARQRKLDMLALAEENPETFLQKAVSSEIRNSLPEAIRNEVEEETTIEGEALVYHSHDFEANEHEYFYYLVTESQTPEVFYIYSSSELEEIISGDVISVEGYKIDNYLISTNVEELESAPVSASAPQASSSSSPTDGHRMKIILATYRDSPPIPFTKEQIKERIFDSSKGTVNKFFGETTNGRLQFYAEESDVTDWIKIDDDIEDKDGFCRITPFSSGFLIFLESIGNIFSGVDHVFIIMNAPNCIGHKGWSTPGKILGKSTAWAYIINYSASYSVQNSDGSFSLIEESKTTLNISSEFDSADKTIIHELGHSIGLGSLTDGNGHAKGFSNFKPPYLRAGDIKTEGYGNVYDVMGSGSAGLDFNAFLRDKRNWFAFVPKKFDITSSGVYSLKPRNGQERGPFFADIRLQYNDVYRLEYKANTGFEGNVRPGEALIINRIFDIDRGYETDNIYITNLYGFLDFYGYRDYSPNYPRVYSKENDQIYYNFMEDMDYGITIGPVVSSDDNEIKFLVTYNKDNPQLFFEADKTTVAPNSYVALKWWATGDSTCVASEDWTGDFLDVGTTTMLIIEPKTYTLTCTKGGKSITKNIDINIDSEPPHLNLLFEQGQPQNWIRGNMRFVIQCEDENGCEKVGYYFSPHQLCSTYYIYNEAGYQSSLINGSVTNVETNSHSWLCAYAKDNSGLENLSKPIEIKIDNNPPLVTISNASGRIEINCQDSESGCDSIIMHKFVDGSVPDIELNSYDGNSNSVSFTGLALEGNTGNGDGENIVSICNDLTGYVQGVPSGASPKKWLCAYAKDVVGNIGFAAPGKFIARAFQLCGNDIIEGTEQCDDGNRNSNDGCSSTCGLESQNVCGNNVTETNEQCDDGNLVNEDGCSSECVIEALSLGVCGDGTIQTPNSNGQNEACDDGNNVSGDGCSSTCQKEGVVSRLRNFFGRLF